MPDEPQPPTLNPGIFYQQFLRFEQNIRANSKERFTSFKQGFAAQWEDYKPRLRDEALSFLKADEWRASDVQKHGILENLIASIEIRTTGRKYWNNLVRWENKWGHEHRSHHVILDAKKSRSLRRTLQQWCFNFFRNGTADIEAFESLRAVVGDRYDLLAYLFFLKDSNRFMPIATTTFDQAFQLLGINFRTARKCSWENYVLYTEILTQIQKALREIAELEDVRLIDAHSFCWMLVRLPVPSAPSNPVIPKITPFGDAEPGAPYNFSGNKEPGITTTAEDFAFQDERRRSTGRLAEGIALDAERKRLRHAGRSDLALRVRDVSEETWRHYDILSFETDGTERHIEVKAARRSGAGVQFYISEYEMRESEERSAQHYFYLVFGCRTKTPKLKYLRANQVTRPSLTAVNYIASLTGQSQP